MWRRKKHCSRSLCPVPAIQISVLYKSGASTYCVLFMLDDTTVRLGRVIIISVIPAALSCQWWRRTCHEITLYFDPKFFFVPVVAVKENLCTWVHKFCWITWKITLHCFSANMSRELSTKYVTTITWTLIVYNEGRDKHNLSVRSWQLFLWPCRRPLV